MEWVDYAILGVVLLSTVFSILRGFVREALSLIGWVLAFWVALTFESNLQIHLEPWISQVSLRHMLAFFALFLGTLLLSGLVGYLVGKFMLKSGLSGTDRMLGMIFGCVRGLIICLIPVVLAMRFGLADHPDWQSSIFLPHMESLALWLHEVLPPDLAEYIDPGSE